MDKWAIQLRSISSCPTTPNPPFVLITCQLHTCRACLLRVVTSPHYTIRQHAFWTHRNTQNTRAQLYATHCYMVLWLIFFIHCSYFRNIVILEFLHTIATAHYSFSFQYFSFSILVLVFSIFLKLACSCVFPLSSCWKCEFLMEINSLYLSVAWNA